MIVGVCRLIANHLHLAFFESTPEVRVLPSTGITRLQRSYYPVRLPPMPPPEATLRPLPSHQTGLPRLPEPPFRRAVPTTPADRAGAFVDCFPASRSLPLVAGGSASALSLSRPAQASLTLRPAGSLSRPQATFVTRLQPMRLPAQAARQLPDQSTTLRVDSSSTDDSRLRGALPQPDSCTAANNAPSCDDLLDHLVGEQLDRVGHLDAERPGRSQVDDELEFGRLQHRQVGGLRALEDFAGVDADLTMHVQIIGPIAH